MWIVFQVDVTPANLLPTSLSSLRTLMPHLQSLSLQSHCAITEYQHIKHLRINFKNISTSKILSCRLYTAHTINLHTGRVVCFVLNFYNHFWRLSFSQLKHLNHLCIDHIRNLVLLLTSLFIWSFITSLIFSKECNKKYWHFHLCKISALLLYFYKEDISLCSFWKVAVEDECWTKM